MGEEKDGKWHLGYNKLKNYAIEIFHVQESKLEEFIQLLKDERMIEMTIDKADETKTLVTREPEAFRTFQVFFNTQRALKDDKKIVITTKCEKFLMKVMEQIDNKKVADGKVEVNLTEIVNYFKDYNIPITLDDFQGAQRAKFCGEYKMGDNGTITCIVNAEHLRVMFPVVKFMNALNRLNDAKSKV